MSILLTKNKCFFKAACALAFLLALSLTACDGDDKTMVRLDDSGAETPSPATKLPLKVEDLICSDDMQVDGRYLRVFTPEDDEYSYYKCENGKWISVTEAEVSEAKDSTEETIVFEKCLGVACDVKRTFADFRKCNAKNEGLVDSTGQENVHMFVDFYTCKNNEWVRDDETSCEASLRHFEIGESCDESLEIDGAYYKVTETCSSMPRYWKCENSKWSLLSKGDEPPDSAMVLTYAIEPFRFSGEREMLEFKKCNTENEGLVDSVVHIPWNPKIDYGYTKYYRCEQGSWNEFDGHYEGLCGVDNSDEDGSNLVCDTAGVSVGAICKRSVCLNTKTMMGCHSVCYGENTYLYMGDGVWEFLAFADDFGKRSNSDSSLAQWTMECTAENEGRKEKHSYGVAPDVIEFYYKCVDGKWIEMSESDYENDYEIEYYCTAEKPEKPKIGDTCSVKLGDSTRHYLFIDVQLESSQDPRNMWVESTVDSVLGYCPQVHTETRYIQKDEKFYYCYGGEWLEAGLVPHQYTDPRKEGLTDEEYDVLDLPKEASVGDRVGGLLENCFNDMDMGFYVSHKLYYETYDYCMSKKYYRYRENGTWTLETEEDLESDKHKNPPECTPESEGAEYISLLESREPGKNFKRISVECESETECTCKDELVGYTFGRSEKK